MNTLQIFRSLGPTDVKNIQRDSMLVYMPFLPLLLTLALRFGVPALRGLLREEFTFELRDYYALLVSFYFLMVPALVGMMVGFLLLDERDDRILSALMVTPLSVQNYLLYRLSLPMIAGFGMTLLCYPLINLVSLSLVQVLSVALLSSFTAPMMALFLAAFAENKVGGLAMVKMVNGINMLPMAAYFLPGIFQILAGVVPPYWGMKVLWLAADGQSYGWTFVLGIIVNTIAIVLLLRRFEKHLYR